MAKQYSDEDIKLLVGQELDKGVSDRQSILNVMSRTGLSKPEVIEKVRNK